MASDVALPIHPVSGRSTTERRGVDRFASPQRRTRPPAFAAIDLGTNNCRMLVGVPSGPAFHVLDSFSRVVRLGEGLYRTGVLSDSAMDRAVDALAICAERLKRWQVAEIRAIATEACRQAENGADFVARARSATGLPLETISPREEVGLALESCASLINQAERRALLFDIGGGSTELAWVRVPGMGADSDRNLPQLIGYHSIPVGVVTLSERCAGWCETEAGFAGVVDEVKALLRPFEQIHRIGQEIRQGGVRLVGTSGTVTTIAGIALNLDRYRRGAIDGAVLPRGQVADGLASICAMGRAGLAQHPCIGPDRVDFVLPGCAIFAAIEEMWPTQDLAVADRGLREGMLMRMIRSARSRHRRYNA
ncbi:Ppx/GppA family phosphatase [Acidiphilium sp. AL]|uniref:Ppx/GppA family phosphatase n=1 Tax=Acidiphilium iwatense TaxID=768198 RepID=A0ABS9E0W2_9PROT|nr:MULTISPECIES: Ppx/GppA phosphatase family protein [Acidiphilium]MCF3948579.1 Ppx/GppA family phosphatase [Acidiphilium iwatense]MCU4161951.1 Ppx/GppA family phosphatase [Acidiphilium sp. AL]